MKIIVKYFLLILFFTLLLSMLYLCFKSKEGLNLDSWQKMSSCCINTYFVIHNDYIYSSHNDGYIWRTNAVSKPATSWQQMTFDGWVSQLQLYGSYIYGVGKDFAVYRIAAVDKPVSTVGGSGWQQMTPPKVMYIEIYDNYIYALKYKVGIYRTPALDTPQKSWQLITQNSEITQFTISNNIIYGVGSNGNIYKNNILNNSNNQWTLVISNPGFNQVEICKKENIMVGLKNYEIYYRNNDSTSQWKKFDNQHIGILYFKLYNNYIYACGTDKSLYRKQFPYCNNGFNNNLKFSPNIVGTAGGSWGGSCTCPDGQVYGVSDNGTAGAKLACYGGISGSVTKGSGSWSGKSVTCGKLIQPKIPKNPNPILGSGNFNTPLPQKDAIFISKQYCEKNPSNWCTHKGATSSPRKCGNIGGWWCQDTNGNTGFLPCGKNALSKTTWPNGKCETSLGLTIPNYEGIYDSGTVGLFIIRQNGNRATIWPQLSSAINKLGRSSNAYIDGNSQINLTWSGPADGSKHIGKLMSDGIAWDGSTTANWIKKGSAFSQDICYVNYNKDTPNPLVKGKSIECGKNKPYCNQSIHNVKWGKCSTNVNITGRWSAEAPWSDFIVKQQNNTQAIINPTTPEDIAKVGINVTANINGSTISVKWHGTDQGSYFGNINGDTIKWNNNTIWYRKTITAN